MRTFPKDFIWGVASAAYQIEGAANVDGRGPSIWDTFSHTSGNVYQGHNGDIACDHYNRYKEDVQIIKNLGVDVYRFSISWSRIFPRGRGEINQKGVDFYNNLINELVAAGVRPAVTLYHWDLPQALEDEGGWRNRDICQAFTDYAEFCFNTFGDRVSMWSTFNEPFCTVILGHLSGVHAPGLKDEVEAAKALHYLYLSHGMVVKRFRKMECSGEIGIVLNPIGIRPATRNPEDIEAHRIKDVEMNRLFMDPLFGKGYPEEMYKISSNFKMPIEEGDMEIISQKIDFLGINYYSESPIRMNEANQSEFTSTSYPKTSMGWDIVPAGLFRTLKRIASDYGNIPLYITENGCALADSLSESGEHCHDEGRIQYLKSHFKVCLDLIETGVNLKGYMLWSLIDNFEWSFGYSKRFGIVYCDYVNQRRIEKDSYYYYREVVAGNELYF